MSRKSFAFQGFRRRRAQKQRKTNDFEEEAAGEDSNEILSRVSLNTNRERGGGRQIGFR